MNKSYVYLWKVSRDDMGLLVHDLGISMSADGRHNLICMVYNNVFVFGLDIRGDQGCYNLQFNTTCDQGTPKAWTPVPRDTYQVRHPLINNMLG